MLQTTLAMLAIFVIGLAIGAIVMFGFCASKFTNDDPIGDLRIDESDPDGPYLFLELDQDVDLFRQKDTVTLNIKNESFIPQK